MIAMSFLKSFLFKETVSILDFNVSTFILAAIFLWLIIFALLKFSRKNIKGIKLLFLTFEIISMFYAFTYALTGESLFSQQENLRIFSIIVFGFFVKQIRREFKEIYK